MSALADKNQMPSVKELNFRPMVVMTGGIVSCQGVKQEAKNSSDTTL